MRAEMLREAVGLDPDGDFVDLAELAVWAAVETTLVEQHRARGRDIKASGRTWGEIAAAVGLSGSSSAESRYSGLGAQRARASYDRKKTGAPPARKGRRSKNAFATQKPAWL